MFRTWKYKKFLIDVSFLLLVKGKTKTSKNAI